MLQRLQILLVAALVTVVAGCTVNPVTGQRQLALVSPQEEVQLGEQYYAPLRQMEGGDYVLHPELTTYVAEVGQKLAAVSDRNLPYEFVVLNSAVPNAWALPGGKIAINRGLLLELESEAELAAVLAHEIVHAAARHGATAMQRGMILQGAVLATAVATRSHSGLAVGAAAVGAQLVNQRYGRGAELEADRYGMEYMARAGYDPQAAVSLQETFVRLSEGRSEGWLAGLFASHPPSADRVDQNRRTAASLPAGGELGRERYQAAIEPLRRLQPAHDAYQQGRRALAENRLDEAVTHAEEALRMEPREADFHALRGDIEFRRQNYTAALEHYDRAVAQNGQFFYYHLRKGLTHHRLGQMRPAETSLERSVLLLPTADGYYALGDIAERRSDRAGAIQRYEIAAGSSSPAGEAAQDALVRLELPQEPGKYLRVGTGLDGQGQLIVEIANPTRLPVADVDLAIRYTDAAGVVRQTSRRVTGPVAGGSSQRLATGLGPFTTGRAYEVTAVSARVVAQ